MRTNFCFFSMEWSIRESWPAINLLGLSYCVCCNLRCYRSRIIRICFHTLPYKIPGCQYTSWALHLPCKEISANKCTVFSTLWMLTKYLEASILLFVCCCETGHIFFTILNSMHDTICQLWYFCQGQIWWVMERVFFFFLINY